jgi:hypothetical protein
MDFRKGMIVRNKATGFITLVSRIENVEDVVVLFGSFLKKDLTPDKRRWSNENVEIGCNDLEILN